MEIDVSTRTLLAQAKCAIDSTDRFFLEQGVDPGVVRKAINTLKSNEVSADIANEIAKVEQEITQEVSRLRSGVNAESVGAGTGTNAKRFRPMV